MSRHIWNLNKIMVNTKNIICITNAQRALHLVVDSEIKFIENVDVASYKLHRTKHPVDFDSALNYIT